MNEQEPKIPRCECGEDLELDPYTRIWYCKTCDPQFHKEVRRDIREEREREEKAKQIREEYLNTCLDVME